MCIYTVYIHITECAADNDHDRETDYRNNDNTITRVRIIVVIIINNNTSDSHLIYKSDKDIKKKKKNNNNNKKLQEILNPSSPAKPLKLQQGSAI